MFVSNSPIKRIDPVGKDDNDVTHVTQPITILSGVPDGDPTNTKEGDAYVFYNTIITKINFKVIGPTGESPSSDGMYGVSGGGDEGDLFTYYGEEKNVYKKMLDSTSWGAPCYYKNKCCQKCKCGSLSWSRSWVDGLIKGYVESEQEDGPEGTITKNSKCVLQWEDYQDALKKCWYHRTAQCAGGNQ